MIPDYLKKNSRIINDKVTLWIAGKEDIAYENCQVMLSKFKELNINISECKINYRNDPHCGVISLEVIQTQERGSQFYLLRAHGLLTNNDAPIEPLPLA